MVNTLKRSPVLKTVVNTLVKFAAIVLFGMLLHAVGAAFGVTAVVAAWGVWLTVRTFALASYGKASFSLAAAAQEIPPKVKQLSFALTSLLYNPEKISGLSSISGLPLQKMEQVYTKLNGVYLGLPWLTLVVVWLGWTFGAGSAILSILTVFVCVETIKIIKKQIQHKAVRLLKQPA